MMFVLLIAAITFVPQPLKKLAFVPQPLRLQATKADISQPEATSPRDKTRHITVVSDPSVCIPCRRLEPELAKLAEQCSVTVVTTHANVQRMPTIIYRGHQRVGAGTAGQVLRWMHAIDAWEQKR